MTDTTTPQIEPLTIGGSRDNLFAQIQYLDGEELDLLDELGIHLASLDEGNLPNRMIVAIGWIHLRRKHPGLSYEDGRKHIRVELGKFAADGEVAADVDPTVASG